MILQCTNFVNESDVDRELATLGLSVDLLKEVIRQIALTMNNHTDDHPTWGPGITVASEAVYALRSILKPDGWRREEEKGFALTVHPDNLIAINIAKGDDGVSDPSAEVLSVSNKGVCTKNAVHLNQNCFAFMTETSPTPGSAAVGRPTWYLLYTRKADGIHAELSLPTAMADTDQISGWIKRIHLPVTRLDGEGETTAGFDDGGFEVAIKRKTA